MSRYDPHEKWLQRERNRIPTKTPKKKESSKKMSDAAAYNKKMQDFFTSASFSFVKEAAPSPPPPPPVRWEDVIGQAEAKTAVKEVIEGVTKHAALYKKYGRRAPRGVLLYGPPGNGKTLLAKAAAHAMASAHGQEARKSGFIYAKSSDLFDKLFGGTEKIIAGLFQRAKEHKRRYGYPAVLFLDEAENVLGHRGGRLSDGVSVNIGPDICVPAFLAEMDGLEESSAIVLLATNRQHVLDPAVVREGRIDRKVFVGRPSREDAKAFFAHYLNGRPLSRAVDELARVAVEALFDERHALYHVRLQSGQEKVATLGDFTSGAQIAYLVDAATSFAIDREIATGTETSVLPEDFVAAVERTAKEQRGLDHYEALVTFCEPFGKDVVEIERVRVDGTRAKKSLIAEVPKGVEVEVVGLGRERAVA